MYIMKDVGSAAKATSMKVGKVEPNIDTGALLAGAQFCDAYSIGVDHAALDARHAAERMLGRSPRWIEALLALRNALVKPFGLKTSLPSEIAPANAIGLFPILSQTPDRLVAGFNDKHLDLRVVVDVTACGQGRRVTATTLVLTHNLLGPGLSRDDLAVSPSRRPRDAAASCRLRRTAAGRRRGRICPVRAFTGACRLSRSRTNRSSARTASIC
jgi:hypothetical protein